MQDTKQETALSAQERYFALLGDAFAVPLQTTAFEQFLETAHTYFVGEPGKATMAPDFPRRRRRVRKRKNIVEKGKI